MKINTPISKIPCKICKKIRMVKTNGMLVNSYFNKKPFCHSCASKNVEEKIKKGWFTRERLLGNKFRKGIPAWNKGKKGIHLSPHSEFKTGQYSSEKNNRWKGNHVGYFGLHTWVQRKLGKAKKCSSCGSIKKVQWANKTWEYKRDIEDWIELCFLCHRKYDNKNWGVASKKFPEIRRCP